MELVKKAPFSSALLSLVIILNIGCNTLFNTETVKSIIDTYGVVFSKIDHSIIYRAFTMVLFTNGWLTFIGVITMSYFLFRFEMLRGTKEIIAIFFITNTLGMIFEYIIVMVFLNFSYFTDLAMSNGEFGVFAAYLFVEPNLKIRKISFLALSLFTLVLLFTPFWADQLAHIGGFLAGLFLYRTFFKQSNYSLLR